MCSNDYDTKRWATIAGVYSLVVVVADLTATSAQLATSDVRQRIVVSDARNSNWQIVEEDLENRHVISRAIYILGIVVDLLYFVVSFLLFYGLHKERRCFLWPWIVFSVIIVQLGCLGVIFRATKGVGNQYLFLIYVVVYALWALATAIVYNHLRNMMYYDRRVYVTTIVA